MKPFILLGLLLSILSIAMGAAPALFEDGTQIKFQASPNKDALVIKGEPKEEENFVIEYIRKPGSEVIEDRPLKFSKPSKDSIGRELRVFNTGMLGEVGKELDKTPDANLIAFVSIHCYKGENVALLRQYQLSNGSGCMCGGSDKATIMKFEAVYSGNGKFLICNGEFKGQTLGAVPNRHLEAIEGKWDGEKHKKVIFKAQVINDTKGTDQRETYLLIEKGYTLSTTPLN